MLRFCFLAVALLVGAQQMFGQEVAGRPKVGLVLSGGGAKGLAHIGILRAMEKAGLTPDYVTGTSINMDGGLAGTV